STTATSNFSLVADYSGSNFFSGFTAFTGADPTVGTVQYVGLEYAASKSYAGYIFNEATNSTNVYIGADFDTVTANRPSVRLTSKQTFEVGTIVAFDTVHVPTGFGVWPALWMLSSNNETWPVGGEIDVVEFVHNSTVNAATLHTAPACTVSNSTSAFQGMLQNADCNSGQAANGCSVQAQGQNVIDGKTMATAGKPFNDQQGGVYVMAWLETGISVYLFGRSQLPSDLASDKPDPASWTAKPMAQFSGSGCDYTKSFQSLAIITDLTFCGQWAGNVWASSGAAAATGVATCAAYVQNNPSAFKDAYFELASIKVYSMD
ncbi:glycoside hydrolase family 16 protein, partial [Baudoinia panamericana UAMH 10762]